MTRDICAGCGRPTTGGRVIYDADGQPWHPACPHKFTETSR